MKFIRSILFAIVLLSSCASYENINYAPIESLKSLEGIYCELDSGKYNSKIFKLEFQDNKTLNWFVLDDNGWVLDNTYKGKYNKKKNTFDIVVYREIKPFIILTKYDSYKKRIGKDSDNNLIIDSEGYQFGFIIPLIASSYSFSHVTKASTSVEYPPFPILIGEKWGYGDFLTDSLLIEAHYDSVCPFEKEIARVRFADKWGLIDKKGKFLVPLQYDEMSSFKYDDISYVRLNDRWGGIDREGNKLISCKYFKIDPFNYRRYTYFYSEDNKVGILLRDGREILPAEYDKIEDHLIYRGRVIICKDNTKGIVDIDGDGIIYPPIFENIRYVSDEKHPNIMAIASFNGKVYSLDSEGYLYHEAKITISRLLKLSIFLNNIRVKPDYDKKIYYTEFLEKVD